MNQHKEQPLNRNNYYIQIAEEMYNELSILCNIASRISHICQNLVSDNVEGSIYSSNSNRTNNCSSSNNKNDYMDEITNCYNTIHKCQTLLLQMKEQQQQQQSSTLVEVKSNSNYKSISTNNNEPSKFDLYCIYHTNLCQRILKNLIDPSSTRLSIMSVLVDNTIITSSSSLQNIQQEEQIYEKQLVSLSIMRSSIERLKFFSS